MLSDIHWTASQQKEHLISPIAPVKKCIIYTNSTNAQINRFLNSLRSHLNATIFTKATMYNRKNYIHRGGKVFNEVRQGLKTLGETAIVVFSLVRKP